MSLTLANSRPFACSEGPARWPWAAFDGAFPIGNSFDHDSPTDGDGQQVRPHAIRNRWTATRARASIRRRHERAHTDDEGRREPRADREHHLAGHGTPRGDTMVGDLLVDGTNPIDRAQDRQADQERDVQATNAWRGIDSAPLVPYALSPDR